MKPSEKLTKNQIIGGCLIILTYFIGIISQKIPTMLFSSSKMLYQIVAITLFCIVMVVTFLINKKFELKLFEKVKFKWWYILIIIGAALLNLIKSVPLMALFNNTTGTENGAGILQLASSGIVFFTLFYTVIYAPIMEDIIFRGVIMKTFFKKYIWIGFIVSSVLFALLHGPTDLFSFCNYFITGLIFGGVLLITKDLKMAILAHIINNAIPMLFLLTALQ